MEKIFYIILILFSLSFPNLIIAGEWIVIENPLEAETLEELIGNIIEFLRNIGLAIAPVLLIVAGFFFVTALGDPQKIQTAKNIILYTLIGLAILIVADVLVDVIRDVLEANEAQQ